MELTPRARLAGLGMTQAGLRRLMIELGDTRKDATIEKAIARALDQKAGGEWLPVVLGLIEQIQQIGDENGNA